MGLHDHVSTGGIGGSGVAGSLGGYGGAKPFIEPLRDYLLTAGLPGEITFTRTSSGTRHNPSALLVTDGSNVARFDHDMNGNALGLLIEESRQNVCFQSENFATTWTNINTTIATDAAVAPDGNTTMDAVMETATTALHEIVSNSHTKTAAAEEWTASVFVKGGLGRDFAVIILSDAGTGDSAFIECDVTDGSISQAATTSGTFSAASGGVIDVGGGIYRVWVTATTNADAVVRVRLRVRETTGSSSYLGDITKGMYGWGAQLELGAFPTSYDPTTTSAVTRAADVSTISGTDFSDWYNPTEGTFVVGWDFLPGVASAGGNNYILQVFEDSSNRYRLWVNASSTAVQISYRATAGSRTIGASSYNQTGLNKVAFAYAANDGALCLNGGAVGTDSLVNLITPTSLEIGHFGGSSQANGRIRRLAYYPIRLSDAQLQALTA